MNRSAIRSLALIALLPAIAACGQKGPLFIPGDIATTETISVSEDAADTGNSGEDGEEKAPETTEQ